ncbi:class I SAM-dependent methyltransferase [Neisseria lactamica]|uniref:class I SAM-dependent methyltransferase n=1 Tax=Neisseria lactamica TaxID=486 RepID=UPI000303144F|nr:class I SAM-dependent methyltransferase [Neisseria lactamica]
MLLQNIIPFAHCLLRQALPEGGNALDGTAGNGHDTLFLAQTTGIRGKVWAFDIQPQALSRTRCRLKEAGCRNVQLISDGHENLKQYVSEPLNAAIFNFGWLPGGDKSLTTRTETSIPALSAALSLLEEGGMLVAVLYPGHGSGKQEAEAVEQWSKGLPQEQFAVLRYGFTNRKNNPPYLLAFEKLRQK